MRNSQRVKGGTKRPSGKREKTRANRLLPTKSTQRAAHCQNQECSKRALDVVPRLPMTSMIATSQANQVSDLPQVRQKITPPTPNHTREPITVRLPLNAE